MAEIELGDVCNQSLREMFGNDQDGKEDFRYIDHLTKMVLFSQFPRRRRWAEKGLSKAFYGANISVETLKDRGLIYIYLKFEVSNKYIFVGRYRKGTILFEPVPSEEEIAQWPPG